MNFSNYRLSLDIHETESGLSLRAKKGDTIRKLYVTLMDGGSPYRITEDCTAAFTARKPDNTILFNEASIENNAIVYALTPQTTAAAGQVRCEVRLYGGDGRLITSPRFFLDVDDTVFTEGDEVVSDDEYTILEDALKKVDQAVKDFEDLIASGHFTDQVSKAFLHKSGGTMTGAIVMSNKKITDLGTPTADADATTKKYVDDRVLTFENTVVSTEFWAESVDLKSYGFPMRARIPLAGVTVDMVPDVCFRAAEIYSGNYSAYCKAAAGVVYIYAAEAPSADITIPTIRVTK